jgi:hypothetical protein
MPDPAKRIHELELEIEEIKACLPAHSVPPTMLQQLEDLEEELEQLRTQTKPEKE